MRANAVLQSLNEELTELMMGAESTVGDWRDTVVVPVGGRVVLRMNVTDFTGIFPFHCHVTAHQDLGMMQFVEVAKPGECSTHSA